MQLTATPNNDLTEGTALRRLFGEQVPPFSSTKGFTGHALAAAGGIEAVLSALAIGHGLRYGNPGFAEPIPGAGAAARRGDGIRSRKFGAVQFVRVRRKLFLTDIRKMKVYVNCITSGAELRSDIKVLIPEMNLRRRMSRVVKSGVAAGIESLLEFGARAPIDAIITATGLGCIADSEKFLDGLIAGDETMLNPTPSPLLRDAEPLQNLLDRGRRLVECADQHGLRPARADAQCGVRKRVFEEKFLDGLIAGDETMLNPTPFIQSTFNTVGAQIALLRGLHCYNTTYVHRWTSFENALTDAALRIGAGWSQAVLVGVSTRRRPRSRRFCSGSASRRRGDGANRRYSSC